VCVFDQSICFPSDEVPNSDYSSGKVKLEMLYNSKQEVLSVMVRHVKGLVSGQM